MVEQFNLAVYFVDRHLAEGRGGKTAVISEGRAQTYAEVSEQVNQAGNLFRGIGVGEGDRVLLLLPDGPEFIAAYFGAVKIGAVAVPTSTALRASDYAYFLEESQARALVVHTSLRSQVEPAIAGRSRLAVIETGGEWLSGQSAALEMASTRADDIAFWLWTSGSTGSPKAAVHRHGDWLWCCENYACGVLEIGPDDVTFSPSKLFHAYGLGNALMFPFYVGATTVLYPGRPQPKVILQKVHEARPTLFFSVPTLYAAMLAETDRENPYSLDSVRLGVSAAEPLPAEIFRRWRERFGFELLDGLGSTEVLHVYTSSRPGRVRPGSTGQPVPGYEIRITGDEGAELAPGEVGDLWVRGKSTAPCYWNRPELSARRMQGGWFFTGDKFYSDPDGYLWYAGRSDDMFRVAGQWVSPNEVEAALIEHPAVLESAVVPYTDENGLLKPKAYVVLKSASRDDLIPELQAFVKGRIAPYKYPRKIEFLNELPKTATGKIQRYKLR